MVRSFVLTLALIACGCGDETVLRITVQAGVSPPPSSLRVTLFGDGITAPPRTFTPVAFPGVIVVHGISAAASDVCVQAEGLDGNGNFLVGGSTTVQLLPHRTTLAEVQMSNAYSACAQPVDLGAPPLPDLAAVDLAEPPPPDGGVLACPAGALFCDDFESGTLAKWSQENTKYDLGSLDVQGVTVAHGLLALHAAASGSVGMSNLAQVEYDFPARQPPLAIRANVYAPVALTNYTMVLALYDLTTHGFSLGGDKDTTWVVTEDDGMGAADHHSDLGVGAGRWHCLELVIDAAGQVTAFVDNRALAGPFGRVSAVAYRVFIVGVARTVFTDTNVFVDDVAMGPSRLYCPQ